MEKQFHVAELKAAPDDEYDGTFVLNEESEDRVGDVIVADGWDLKDFRKNSPALWGHDPDKLIGRWDNVRVEGKRLLGQLKLASTPMAQMAKTLIQEGILKAVSVGFAPKEYEPRKNGGYLIKKASLMEVSLVSVPAHPNALLLSKQLGLTAGDRRAVFGSSSKKDQSMHKLAAAKRDLAEIRKYLESYP